MDPSVPVRNQLPEEQIPIFPRHPKMIPFAMAVSRCVSLRIRWILLISSGFIAAEAASDFPGPPAAIPLACNTFIMEEDGMSARAVSMPADIQADMPF